MLRHHHHHRFPASLLQDDQKIEKLSDVSICWNRLEINLKTRKAFALETSQ